MATIKDIAKLCGVSEGTVDRAINDRAGINPETKKRIMEVVEQVNYKPDRIAQSLAKGKTRTLGLIFFDLNNDFIAALVDTIETIAKEKGYFISLVLTHGIKEEEIKGINYLLERKVDGIIVFPVGKQADYQELKINIPVISIYNKISDEIPYVGVDAQSAMRDAIGYIADCQYERVMLVNSSITKKVKSGLNVYTLQERQKGYIEGIEKNNINEGEGPLIVEGLDFNRMDTLYRQGQGKRTAFLCICDVFALEVLTHFREQSLKVPEDVGIMGFDNMSIRKYVSPQLTTVGYHMSEMAQKIFVYLMEMIHGSDIPKDTSFPCQIIEGNSL